MVPVADRSFRDEFEQIMKEPIIFATGKKPMFYSFQTSMPRKQTLGGNMLELDEVCGR